MSGPAILSIAEAGRLIGARQLSPVELLQDCLGRIDAVDDVLNSFVTVTRDRAMAEARAAEAAIMQDGPPQPDAWHSL
ncbi:MAG: hypothetical protein WDN49_01000 [Acetobacteraceae bacterium]